jgi:cation-transporting ATPase 13A1
MEGQTKMRAELEHSLGDLNDPNRPTKKVGWFDWMDMDIEEHAERKRREKEKTVLDSLPKKMRVPNRHAPAFTPSLLLGILVTFHALVVLMQHWSVKFNVWLNYREVDAESVHLTEEMMDLHLEDNDEGSTKKTEDLHQPLENLASFLPTHARVVPAKGKDVLVSLEYFPTLGMTLEYHRRRYIYKDDQWTKIRCRTNIPLDFFDEWRGFRSLHQVVSAQIRYGPNKFDVKQPTFTELYKAQLLSPFTVFQLFCVILWMLDDYWQYSAFTLFMIFTFEATVVFSRIKSLSALRGMGNKARNVHVYRLGQWIQVQTTDLLPCDLISLTRVKPHYAKEGEKKVGTVEDEGGDIVPADLLLLRGSTVVNEASLTGESVPQMKEGLVELEADENLSMKNRHKMHILYAGTKMLQCKPATTEESASDSESSAHPTKLYSQIPAPPDDGCLCFVLRTGFSAAQGKLVRMIEGSQEKVKGHERETGLLLLLLFFFAVASSSYVLYHGMHDENRSQYELLLHCILIITSVIPPELPMQMALAVNNSLMTLMKMQIFCTEPFRVPMAGKLDACLFDKTGTLTTDELVAVGVCEPPKLKVGDKREENLTAMSKINSGAALVLAGCHSLVFIDDETTGDPLESASLNAMRWCVSPSTGHVVPAPATEKKPAGQIIHLKSGANISEIEILTRHHFSSKLQRMSCVIRDCSSRQYYAVAKGSPEAVGNLLASKPDGYDEQSKFLAKQGYRVIALASKLLTDMKDVEAAKDTRASCESDLTFAGFIAFTCRVRKDTAVVLRRLKDGGMSIAMVTGDALLTAAHVAKEVGICGTVDEDDQDLVVETNPELRAFLESKRRKPKKPKKDKEHLPILILEESDEGSMYWQSYETGSRIEDYVADNVPELAKGHDLATTGKSLAAAFAYDAGTRKVLAHFKIFARMSPDAKEEVIECLHSVDLLCLMCGDGANDVGALKQADVGVALLSGFGDVNVDRGEDSNAKKKSEEKTDFPATAIISQDKLNAIRQLPVMLIKAHIRKVGGDPDKYPEIVEKEDLVKLYQIKAREYAIKQHEKNKSKMTKAELQAKKRAEIAEKQRLVALRTAELEAQGESWAQFKAMKEIMGKEVSEARKKQIQQSSIEGSAATIAGQLEDMETGDLPMVKLGDASIAAPFTSKIPSIRSCVDIVRQGRCTLVSSIQMVSNEFRFDRAWHFPATRIVSHFASYTFVSQYQILALNCLISSYSLSVLYLDGVKYGDTQMTAMGMLGSISFMSVSRSKPLDKLSKVKPLTSIFHPALFLSLLGQFCIHLFTMVVATQAAKNELPPDYKADLDGVFKPGILNTVVFLVSNVQQVTVFVVNLQGRPFMTGLTENRPLLWSLLATFILTFMFASETVPGLNKYFQLVPFPDEAFRDFILKILLIDVTVSFSFDRLMKFIFCPKILFASIEGTSVSDVMRLGRTVAVIGFLMYTMLGNDEQWEELLREEARLAELSLLNETADNGTIGEAVMEGAKACVGAACDAAVGGIGMHEEF